MSQDLEKIEKNLTKLEKELMTVLLNASKSVSIHDVRFNLVVNRAWLYTEKKTRLKGSEAINEYIKKHKAEIPSQEMIEKALLNLANLGLVIYNTSQVSKEKRLWGVNPKFLKLLISKLSKRKL